MLVPAWDLGSWQGSEVDASLAGPNVALTLAASFAATEMHLASATLSAVFCHPEEWREVPDKLILVNAQVVVEQIEQLLFHEVNFGLGEEGAVTRPMLVLW